ncbi:MAG: hypothetical protein ACOH1T_04355 [Microbacteriaceae bacterium]
MTTSHENRPMSRRRWGALTIVAAVLCSSLAGCAPQSETSAREYARTLETASAVQSVSVGVSTPLPFTVQASLSVLLSPDVTRASLDELRELACSTPVNASISLTLAYELEGGARLTQRVRGKCFVERAAFLDVVPVLVPLGAQVTSVTWSERDDDGDQLTIDMRLEDDSDAGFAAGIADDVLATLDYDPTVDITVGSVDITATSVSDAREISQAVVGLSKQIPVASARFDSGLFVQLATEEPGAVEAARAYLAEASPSVAILSIVDSSVDVSSGVPNQATLDADEVLRDADLGDSVTVGRKGLNMWISQTDTMLEVTDLLRSKGLDGVSVDYSVFADGSVIATAKPDTNSTPLTSQQVSDAKTIIDAFAETGKLGSLTYTPKMLTVFLATPVYDDEASKKQFRSILSTVLRSDEVSGTFDYVELNNVEVKKR